MHDAKLACGKTLVKKHVVAIALQVSHNGQGDCPYCAILCLFLGSELGADSLDLKLELVAAYKLDLMHVYVKVVAYGAVS